MPACHAGGHEFESRTHRFLIVKKVNVVAFTFFYSTRSLLAKFTQ